MVAAIKRSAAPTRADFHEAISRRSDRWYSACLRITRNPELAADAVQDALLLAWNKRAQFRRDSSLETWIHRIAVNSALQLVRKERPGRFEPLEADLVDEGDSPEDSLSQRDIASALTNAFAHLSDIERICFVLKHFEQWRLKEIAGELDSNVDTVKQAIFRAVRKLRTKLQHRRSMQT